LEQLPASQLSVLCRQEPAWRRVLLPGTGMVGLSLGPDSYPRADRPQHCRDVHPHRLLPSLARVAEARAGYAGVEDDPSKPPECRLCSAAYNAVAAVKASNWRRAPACNGGRVVRNGRILLGHWSAPVPDAAASISRHVLASSSALTVPTLLRPTSGTLRHIYKMRARAIARSDS
jgi:hypothetical protein